MVVTAQDLREAGVRTPLLVGGAALSSNFTRKRIAPAYGTLTCYAKDAMSGLALLDKALDPAAVEDLAAEHAPLQESARDSRPQATSAPAARSSRVRRDVPPLQSPYVERKCEDIPHLRELWQYVNPVMLYSRHLGFKGNFKRALADRDEKALALHAAVEDAKAEAESYMRARAVWRFLEAESCGNSIRLF
ncbi:MAG: methionine synthase, partial [Bryobacterales bacterium]|nr:methionine synthase [Bryobacterales bacterium]